MRTRYVVSGWIPNADDPESLAAFPIELPSWNAKVDIATLVDGPEGLDQRFRVSIENATELELIQFADALSASVGMFFGPSETRKIRLWRVLTRARGIPEAAIRWWNGDVALGVRQLLFNRGEFGGSRFYRDHFLVSALSGLSEPNLRRSATYLVHSLLDASFTPDEITVHEERPRSDEVMARYEIAHVHAFKAIEALVGDPGSRNPRGEARLERTLENLGINPRTMCGSPRGEAREKIWALKRARDSRSAHGSTPRANVITSSEVIDCQDVARALVYLRLDRLAPGLSLEPRPRPRPRTE